jgi:site-specific recombinase XerD
MVKARWNVPAAVRGPLAAYAVGFWEELVGQGYAPRSAEAHLLLMARMSRWMELVTLKPADVDAGRIDEFMAWSHDTGARFPKSVTGVAPLLDFLRGLGVVPLPSVAPLSADEELLARFGSYLQHERGLADGTIVNHVHAARVFLRTMADADVQDLEALSVADVNGFVVAECRERTIASAKNLVTGLRALLRFLHVEGITPISLSGAVPTVSGWTGGGLPRGVDAVSVTRLLAGCDRRTAKGRRDFAILMILTRLGLRAGEVVALELGDLDWPRGEVLVRGKARRMERMPLPVDVGEAIVAYLRRGRPVNGESALFLRVVAPQRRITVGGISVIVHAACARTGIAPIATHRLRHTVASELLRHGAGLSEIGQVLRHRSHASTARYAKVDTESLRQLARPWPGSVS